MREFQDRLHQRLRDTAAGAGAGPDLDEVKRRARRQRRSAGAIVTGSALTAVAVLAAAVVLLPIIGDRGIELDMASDPAAESGASQADEGQGTPDGDEAPEERPAPDHSADTADPDPEAAPGGAVPASACGTLDRLALVVAGTDGALIAVCADGATARLTEDGQARDPVIAPDGSMIVYEERRGERSVLQRMDTESGEVTDISEGRSPAFSPDGLMAWVEGEAASPTLVVADPDAQPLSERFLGTLVVKDLAWDADGRVLMVDNFPGGAGLSVIDALDADQLPGAPSPPDAADGGRFLAVATSEASGEVGLVRRVGLTAGIQFVTQRQPPRGSETLDPATLASLDGLGLAIDDLSTAQDRADLWLADGRGLWVAGDDELLTRGDPSAGTSWLLGDGETVWLIAPDGSLQVLREQAQGAAVNPALAAD